MVTGDTMCAVRVSGDEGDDDDGCQGMTVTGFAMVRLTMMRWTV